MAGDLRQRLERLDPAPTSAKPPRLALDAEETLELIERRLTMTDQTTGHTKIDVHLGEFEDEGTASRPIRERRDARARIRLALIGVAAAVLFGVISAGTATYLGSTRTFGAAADAEQTIEAYFEAYNAKDIDGVMALFGEMSILRGHPYSGLASGAGGDSYSGLAEIRVVQEQDMENSADVDAYTIHNVDVEGNIVRWDHVYENHLGQLWCGTGHVAEVVDGIIVEWRFAPNRYQCP